MDFKSDNRACVSPEILDAIIAANSGYQDSYGHDEYTDKLKTLVKEIFECDVEIFFTSTGTAANSLALAAICPSYGTIFCSKQAHIINEECGAPAFFTNGANFKILDDVNGKISLSAIDQIINHLINYRPHTSKPCAITITQATEVGTIYNLNELQALKQITDTYNFKLHMDGARFTNALVNLNCSPADMTWRVGVDVLSFGATKNGAMIGEMIVFFDKSLATDFDYLHKRSGQLMSKQRFIANQFTAYLNNDLWLKNARSANSQAKKLKEIFDKNHNCSVAYPVDANELFVCMKPDFATNLMDNGANFYSWDASKNHYRFVISHSTTDAEIASFANLLT